jgi:hypothetical protein
MQHCSHKGPTPLPQQIYPLPFYEPYRFADQRYFTCLNCIELSLKTVKFQGRILFPNAHTWYWLSLILIHHESTTFTFTFTSTLHPKKRYRKLQGILKNSIAGSYSAQLYQWLYMVSATVIMTPKRRRMPFLKLLVVRAVPLVEEANDLAGNVLATGLLVIHNTGGGGQDNVAELTGRQQLDDPLLEVGQADVVAGGDDTGLVETAVELDNNLAGAVVVDLLELANVA